jgi:hypothetical protein
MSIDRRRFLTFAVAGVPLVAVAGRSAGALAQAAACYDSASLPLSQKNRRRSLGYVEASTDPARRCTGCAFFTASGEGCGTCALLSGPVNAGGLCNSFAPRGK